MADGPIVLFVAGLGRSGSTLVDRVLGEVSGYQSLGEVVHLWQRGLIDNEMCGSGEPFHESGFWAEVGEVAFGGWDRVDPTEVLALQRAVDRTRYVPLLAWPQLRPGFLTHIDGYAAILSRVYRAAAEVSGARVLIDSSKHVSSATFLRHVPGVDPRIVHLVRDARGVAYSWGKVKPRPEAGDEAVMARSSPAQAAGWYMAQNLLVEATRSQHVPRIRVRYEDFTADPEGVVRRVLALTGDQGVPLRHLDGHQVTLGPNPNVGGNPMKLEAGPITIAQDDAWRQAMPERDQRLVTVLTAPLLLAYGYPLRTTRTPASVGAKEAM
jgi:hypothetical protein